MTDQLSATDHPTSRSPLGPAVRMLTFALALGVVAHTTHAATLTWDPNGSTVPDPSDGAGAWDLTTANWYDGAGPVLWDNSQGYDAVLGTGTVLPAGGYGITLDTGITLNNLTFNTGNSSSDGTKKYSITGSGTLTFGADSTITIPDQSGGGGATINALIANSLASTLTINNGNATDSSGILNVGGNNTGLLGNVVIGDIGGLIVQQNNVGAFGSAADVSVKVGNSLRFAVTNGIYTNPHFTIAGTGIGNRGSLFITSTTTIQSNITLAESAMVRLDASATLNGNIDEAEPGNTLELRGVTNNVTVTLSGTNSYTGGTVLNANTANKSLTVGVNKDENFGALPGTPNLNINFKGTSTSTTTLRADASFTIAATRNITLATLSSHTFNTNGNNLTVNGVVSGEVPIFKTGGGVLLLNGENTFTGATTVTTGTLGGRGSASSALTLNAGTHLAPGQSGTTGTYLATSLDWNSTAVLDYHLGATSDLLDLTGAFTEVLEGGTYSFFFASAGVVSPGLYTLINFGSTSFEAGTDFSFTTDIVGLEGDFVLNADNLQFQVTAVPETAPAALLALPLLALAWQRRRRGA